MNLKIIAVIEGARFVVARGKGRRSTNIRSGVLSSVIIETLSQSGMHFMG